jgi:hypothetical protein
MNLIVGRFDSKDGLEEKWVARGNGAALLQIKNTISKAFPYALPPGSAHVT